MKKLIFMLILFVFGLAGQIHCQNTDKATTALKAPYSGDNVLYHSYQKTLEAIRVMVVSDTSGGSTVPIDSLITLANKQLDSLSHIITNQSMQIIRQDTLLSVQKNIRSWTAGILANQSTSVRQDSSKALLTTIMQRLYRVTAKLDSINYKQTNIKLKLDSLKFNQTNGNQKTSPYNSVYIWQDSIAHSGGAHVDTVYFNPNELYGIGQLFVKARTSADTLSVQMKSLLSFNTWVTYSFGLKDALTGNNESDNSSIIITANQNRGWLITTPRPTWIRVFRKVTNSVNRVNSIKVGFKGSNL